MTTTIPATKRFIVISGQEVVIPDGAAVIMLDTPKCTMKEYARRTGLTYSGVIRLADKGEIETIKVGDPSGNGARFVNLIKEAQKALDN